MFGYGRNSGISWFRDYGDALHKFKNTDNIRGRVEEPMKPLGLRRSVDMYSMRMREDNSSAIECVLYKTPVITFYPDGLIEIRDDKWTTISTCYFIEEVLGHTVSARLFNSSICVSIGGVETRLGEGVLRIRDGKILNPTTDKTHKIDRKKANNVRKQYAEFVKYGSALVRLKSEGFAMSEYYETFESNEQKQIIEMPDAISRGYNTDFAEDTQKLFDLVNAQGEDKHIAHYKAVLTMAYAFGASRYGGGSYNMTGTHLTDEVFKRKFDEFVIGYHRDEVLVEVERKEGEVKRDPYTKYFENGWKRFHANKVRKG